jgi:hypothetical protein
MDHVVYLDYKEKELEKLKDGSKTMIIRGAMGRKMPYGRVREGDCLYFIENKGDGMVKAKARIKKLFQSDKMNREESVALVEAKQDKLQLNKQLFKRFAGKRYIILMEIRAFEQLEAFKIDRSDYGNMDDWLAVEDIENVRM